MSADTYFESEPLKELVFDPADAEDLIQALRVRYREQVEVGVVAEGTPARVIDLLTREEQDEVLASVFERPSRRAVRTLQKLDDLLLTKLTQEAIQFDKGRSRGGKKSKRSEPIQKAAVYAAGIDDSLTVKEAWKWVSSGQIAKRFDLTLDDDRRLHDPNGKSITMSSFSRYWRLAVAFVRSK
jgi:hypothetical protein